MAGACGRGSCAPPEVVIQANLRAPPGWFIATSCRYGVYRRSSIRLGFCFAKRTPGFEAGTSFRIHQTSQTTV